MDQETALHWLALRLTPGLGTRTAAQLLNSFRSPVAIFRASTHELEGAGLPPNLAQAVASGAAFEEAITQHQKLVEAGAELIPIADARYPARLREIFDPPVVLFAKGNMQLLDAVGVAIVGTRRPTPYGVQVASRLARDLADAGVTVVSGMARGIDTAAHRGALDRASGGLANTIAVFGCGIDQVYPAENRRLTRKTSPCATAS
jgi:DNA processing protein